MIFSFSPLGNDEKMSRFMKEDILLFADKQRRPRAWSGEPGGGCAVTFSSEERANNTNAATGPGRPTATIRHRTGWPPVSPAALLSARERRFEHGCLWTGQENGSGVLYFILTWSEARGQHRLGAALLRFPAICGRHILFLIRRFYREINGKGTGTNEKR